MRLEFTFRFTEPNGAVREVAFDTQDPIVKGEGLYFTELEFLCEVLKLIRARKDRYHKIKMEAL